MKECLKPKVKPLPKWTGHYSEEFISDQGPKIQNYEYPPKLKQDIEVYIVGISQPTDPYYSHCFQFVFNDGT